MSEKQKYRVLVIDDWWTRGREQIYTKVLTSDFELFHIDNGSDLYFQIEEREVDLYLIDIVLTGWQDPKTSQPVEILNVLQKIPTGKPVMLVSNEYKTLVNEKENKLTRLMNEIIEQDYFVTEFIVWNDFIKAAQDSDPMYLQALVNKVKLQLLRVSKKKKAKAHIGIVAALELELNPFLKLFGDAQFEEVLVGNIKFKKGTIITKSSKRINFVAARQPHMGMVDCAYLATIMATTFDIEHLFMIGVCGGRETTGVNIGDLVIPKESVAYQNGKLTENGLLPDYGYAPSNSGLANLLDSDYCKDKLNSLMDKYQAMFKTQNSEYLGVKCPTLKSDEMACGDYIIDKKGALDQISADTNRRKLCSVEMESYSILRLPIIFPKIKATVLKSVMDLTNNKSDKYKDYAAYISANFLYDVIFEEQYKF